MSDAEGRGAGLAEDFDLRCSGARARARGLSGGGVR